MLWTLEVPDFMRDRHKTWHKARHRHCRCTARLANSTRFAERFMDKQGLRPGGGSYRDWRNASGMRVPFEAMVTWQLQSGPFTYAHWLVQTIDYDVTEP